MRFLSLALVLLACVEIVGAQTSTDSKPQWQAPATATAKENPLKNKPELAAGGKKLFARDCAQCHGTGFGHTRNNAPILASEQVQRDSDGAMFWKITNGNTRTGMPSFSSLPDNQRWQLVLYIRSLPNSAGNSEKSAK